MAVEHGKKRLTRGVASTALDRLAVTARERGGLTIGEALASTGEASFGFIMLILALPALIPIPGPFGMVFGSAMAIVALQFAIGAGSLWLPSFLRNQRLSASMFAALQRHADPIVRRIERVIQPGRMAVLTGGALPYVLALPVFSLAVAIALPIPFGNIGPVVAVCVIAVGLIERDGLMVLLGLLLTLVALLVTAALFTGAVSFMSML
ncbi:exopolysaccharide biosynthesis protein (plasmid) [Ensifer sp. D2-11]